MKLVILLKQRMFFIHIRALQHRRTVIQSSLRTVVHRGGKDSSTNNSSILIFLKKSTKQNPNSFTIKQTSLVIILKWVQTVLCLHKICFDKLLNCKCCDIQNDKLKRNQPFIPKQFSVVEFSVKLDKLLISVIFSFLVISATLSYLL